MKWTTATALLLALSAGGVGVAVVATRKPKSPLEVLEEVRSQIDSPLFDRTAALRELERILDGRRGELSNDVAAELLRTRATLYKDLESYDRAREDLELLLTSYRPNDNELRLEIAQLQISENQIFSALRQTRSLTQRDPSFGEAWALQGHSEERLAKVAMEKIFENVELGLSSDQAQAAKKILVELTARDVLDPERGDLVYRLGQAYSAGRESDFEEVLEAVGEPRLAYKRARDAYSRAIETSVTPSTVISLADSLQRAGQLELAIQLQVAARKVPSIADDSGVAASLLDDLVHANRTGEARELVQRWNWQLGASVEFYRSAGEVLVKSENFGALGKVAEGLRRVGSQTGVHWAKFFGPVGALALAEGMEERAARNKLLSRFLPQLSSFAKDEISPEPYFQARKLSYFYLAEGHRLTGNVTAERRVLRLALTQLPKHSADAWVRYAATLRRSPRLVPWKEVEEALSTALDLDPSLTESITPLWYEAGEKTLEKVGTNLRAQIDQAARAGHYLPVARKVGPSVMTQIAQDHLDNGRYYQAIQAAEEARQEFPNLVPPLDIIIAAELATPEKYDVANDIVERIEAAGMSEQVEEFLSQLPSGGLEGEGLVRAIRAAPVRFGKAAVARWHLEHGESEEAGAALEGIDQNSAPAELRLIRARLLLESGDHEGTLAELGRTPDIPRTRARQDLYRLRALLGAGKTGQLQNHVRAMLTRHAPGSAVMLEAVDRLTRAGSIDLAFGLVEQMDQAAETRTADFYRRRLMVDLLLANRRGAAAAKESILRAEPYLQDGSPELAAILLAVSERDWTALPRLVDTIERSKFRADAYQTVALALLGERLEQGSRAAETALEQNPRDPRWALLAAAATALIDGDITMSPWFGPGAAADATRLLRGKDARNARDPRDTIALLLTSRAPRYLAWTAPRVEDQVTATGSTMWGALLQLDIAQTEGRADLERTILDRLLGAHPRFGPGHDLAVRRVEELHPTDPLHPEVVGARARRLDSMGKKQIGNDVEVRIATAGKLARSSKYRQAVETLLPVARSEGPSATEGRIMLSLFQLRAGEPAFAAQYLHQAAMKNLGIYRDAALGSLVDAIRLALDGSSKGSRTRGALTQEDARRMLRDLSAKYPQDPLIALAELELLDVEDGERGRRAQGILQQLQQAAGRRSLNEIRPGATRAWVEFLAPLAAEVASDFVRSELVKEPGNVELLQLAGLIAESTGDLDLARREYETLLAIEPRAETCYALAELLVGQGATTREIVPLLRQANRLRGGPSVRSLYLQSLADLHVSKPRLDVLADRLRNLWNQRQRSDKEVDPVDTGLLYADVLMRRFGPDDEQTLRELLEELRPMVVDRLYRAGFVEALEGIVDAVTETANS